MEKSVLKCRQSKLRRDGRKLPTLRGEEVSVHSVRKSAWKCTQTTHYSVKSIGMLIGRHALLWSKNMGLFFIQEERKISCENANLGVGEMIPVQICISALIDWISNVEAKKNQYIYISTDKLRQCYETEN